MAELNPDFRKQSLFSTHDAFPHQMKESNLVLQQVKVSGEIIEIKGNAFIFTFWIWFKRKLHGEKNIGEVLLPWLSDFIFLKNDYVILDDGETSPEFWDSNRRRDSNQIFASAEIRIIEC